MLSTLVTLIIVPCDAPFNNITTDEQWVGDTVKAKFPVG